MITSIVGRLIKKPELAERIQIPGKRVVNCTLVQNSTRGERRLSVFFNLSMIVATDAQYELVMRLEKNTVLLFSFPRITYVKQNEKSPQEQSINLYAEVDNFKIVAGGESSSSLGSSDFFAVAAAQAPPRQAPHNPSRPVKMPEQTDPDDPFADSEL